MAPVFEPFAHSGQWTVQESWQPEEVVFTFYANCTFHSSQSEDRKERGVWGREGRHLTMFWPRIGTTFRATILGDKIIRGSAYANDGRPIGTFTLKSIPDE